MRIRRRLIDITDIPVEAEGSDDEEKSLNSILTRYYQEGRDVCIKHIDTRVWLCEDIEI